MIEYLVLGGATLGVLGWERLRRARWARLHQQFIATLDADAQVVLHVATREATNRQQPLSALHLLYGLLQDEAFTAELTKRGGDPAALEQKVLDALDRGVADADADGMTDGTFVLGHASMVAQANQRVAGTVDLFARLARTSAGALLETPTAPALLFHLVHGDQPGTTIANEREVHVVIRNDDHTTRELVIEVLRDVFELSDADAHHVMMTANDHGKAIVGRFPAAVARDKIEVVRERAIKQVSPLWIGVEPT